MAKTRFVIALITFHEDKSASFFARLKEFWKCNIDVARPKTGGNEGSAVPLKLLERKLSGIRGL